MPNPIGSAAPKPIPEPSTDDLTCHEPEADPTSGEPPEEAVERVPIGQSYVLAETPRAPYLNPPHKQPGLALGVEGGGAMGIGPVGAGLSVGAGITLSEAGIKPYLTVGGGFAPLTSSFVFGSSAGAGGTIAVFRDESTFRGDGGELGFDLKPAGIAAGSASDGHLNSVELTFGPSVGADVHAWSTKTLPE